MKQTDTELEVRSLDAICINESQLTHKWYHNLKYLVVGILFGIVFVKAEVISWFRIQEMFRLQSFHMYGIIGSAVVVAMLSVWLIKKFNVKTIYGEPIEFHTKKIQQGPDLRRIAVWFWLGDYRSMPGPAVCPNRHRGHCHSHHPAKCRFRNLGVWVDQGEVASLSRLPFYRDGSGHELSFHSP